MKINWFKFRFLLLLPAVVAFFIGCNMVHADDLSEDTTVWAGRASGNEITLITSGSCGSGCYITGNNVTASTGVFKSLELHNLCRSSNATGGLIAEIRDSNGVRLAYTSALSFSALSTCDSSNGDSYATQTFNSWTVESGKSLSFTTGNSYKWDIKVTSGGGSGNTVSLNPALYDYATDGFKTDASFGNNVNLYTGIVFRFKTYFQTPPVPDPENRDWFNIDYGPYYKQTVTDEPSGAYRLGFYCATAGEVYGYSPSLNQNYFADLGVGCTVGQTGHVDLTLSSGSFTQWYLLLATVGGNSEIKNVKIVHGQGIAGADIANMNLDEPFDSGFLSWLQNVPVLGDLRDFVKTMLGLTIKGTLWFFQTIENNVPVYGDILYIGHTLLADFYFNLWTPLTTHIFNFSFNFYGTHSLTFDTTIGLGDFFSAVDSIPNINTYKNLLSGIVLFLLIYNIWGKFNNRNHA